MTDTFYDESQVVWEIQHGEPKLIGALVKISEELDQDCVGEAMLAAIMTGFAFVGSESGVL